MQIGRHGQVWSGVLDAGGGEPVAHGAEEAGSGLIE